MKTELLRASDQNAVRHALDVLRNRGVVAFPTDTVYGVGALVFDAVAVERLYLVKGRSTDKAIAVLVARPEDLRRVARDLPDGARRLAQRFWPGPLTLVVPRHPDLPDIVSALPTVGVRLPDHPVARQLLEMTGPLAVTSANRSGEPSTLNAADVMQQLAGRVDLVLDGGQTPGGVPSTVVDCTGEQPQVLRVGPVSEEEVRRTWANDAAR